MDVVNVELAVLEWAAVARLTFIFSWKCPDTDCWWELIWFDF